MESTNIPTIIRCRDCGHFVKPAGVDETANYLGKCTQPQTHKTRQFRYANHFCGYAKNREDK